MGVAGGAATPNQEGEHYESSDLVVDATDRKETDSGVDQLGHPHICI